MSQHNVTKTEQHGVGSPALNRSNVSTPKT